MRPLIITSLALCSLGAGMDTTVTRAARELGFLLIECDSTGLDIYVDNMLIGPCPTGTPVPLPPGKHTVSYLHPELQELLRAHYGKKEMAGLTARGVKNVYVIPGQTVTVKLWWSPYERELKARKWRFWTKSMVGVALMALVMGLNLL